MVRSGLLVLVLAAALVAVAPVSTAATQAVQRDGSLERSLVQAMNKVRAAHGLRPLRLSPALQRTAVGHSRALASSGLFQHESPDGTPFDQRVRRVYAPRGFASWSIGENLVFGSTPFSADDAVRAWLDSPPHRQNLLNRTWRELGVGAIVARDAGGEYGDEPVVIITADFGFRTR
jgi:uncharacterized protein YkwD